eukprot:1070211-Pelagomonas_calceolata.AAC.2
MHQLGSKLGEVITILCQSKQASGQISVLSNASAAAPAKRTSYLAGSLKIQSGQLGELRGNDLQQGIAVHGASRGVDAQSPQLLALLEGPNLALKAAVLVLKADTCHVGEPAVQLKLALFTMRRFLL